MREGSEEVKGGTRVPSVGGEVYDAERAIESEGVLESISEGLSEVVGAGVQPEMNDREMRPRVICPRAAEHQVRDRLQRV